MPLDQRQRKLQGVFYTPQFLADQMARMSVVRSERETASELKSGITILDPACGDGALLIAAVKQLLALHPFADRVELTRGTIFGVDIDSHAVEQTRQRLLELIAPALERLDEVREYLSRQILCGNALTGPEFSDASEETAHDKRNDDELDWSVSFPEIAKHSGFDLVIANPPYLREKDAKSIFDRIARSSLGERWRKPRMDLWHYFLHRSLDLLKPGGRLCFLINSYWTKGHSARPLIDRLRRETTLEEIVEFDTQPVFERVAGRHMVLQLRKSVSHDPCRVARYVTSDSTPEEPDRTIWLTPMEMFRAGQIVLEANIPLEDHAAMRLGDGFDVRQGIAENPPCINSHLDREFPGEFRVGEGVFVLTVDELTALNLNEDERRLLRSYARSQDLDRYRLPRQIERYLLYLTPQSVPDLSRYPHIERHLLRFKTILDRRREVRKGSIAWWHLHWPREECLFVEPRILHLQMGDRPKFAWTTEPLFVGFSVNVVRVKNTVAANPDALECSLPALTAILNSSAAEAWFKVLAKPRGIRYEISGNLLKHFPLPTPRRDLIKRLGQLSIDLHNQLNADHSRGTHEEMPMIEREIDRIVDELYR